MLRSLLFIQSKFGVGSARQTFFDLDQFKQSFVILSITGLLPSGNLMLTAGCDGGVRKFIRERGQWNDLPSKLD
jgi:hypothetical protein